MIDNVQSSADQKQVIILTNNTSEIYKSAIQFGEKISCRIETLYLYTFLNWWSETT